MTADGQDHATLPDANGCTPSGMAPPAGAAAHATFRNTRLNLPTPSEAAALVRHARPPS